MNEPEPIERTLPQCLETPSAGESDAVGAGRTIEQGMEPLPATIRRATFQAIVEGYIILDEIGHGGMGVVYRAEQTALKRTVAIKMILHGDRANANQLNRFRREAEAIARLQHPNIVQVFQIGEHNGLPFLVMEYCSGGTLAGRYAAGPLSFAEVAELGIALARAVESAHGKKIVHRDLKPGNILLTESGSPKITDFGLAKMLDDPTGATRTGELLGTPAYMSPEQAAGRTESIGTASDIYALGAILYEAAVGSPPHRAPSAAATLEMICNREPKTPRSLRPDLPADLETVILKCLEKEPARRYANVGELADDLERWRRSEPIRARRQGVLRRMNKRLQRRKWTVRIALAAVIFLPLLWLTLADAGFPVPGRDGLQCWLDRRELSAFRPAPSNDELYAKARSLRASFASLLQAVPQKEGWFGAFANKPFDGTDTWMMSQVFAAILRAPEADISKFAAQIDLLPRLFNESEQYPAFTPRFGWPNFNDGEPSNEANAWAATAHARALSRQDLFPAAAREKIRANFVLLQEVLEGSRTREPAGRYTGAWNLFARQVDPSLSNPYITTVVAQALLDMVEADLDWLGSKENRDERLHATLAWLIDRFNGEGWVTPGRQQEELNDGLTIQIFAVLLRAEALGVIQLPDRIAEQIPLRLASLPNRKMDYPIVTAMFSAPFENPQGKLVPRPQRPIRMLWYPWAIDCASRWLKRAESRQMDKAEMVRTRRVLAHLLEVLGPVAEAEAKAGYTYVIAETWIGLNAAK